MPHVAILTVGLTQNQEMLASMDEPPYGGPSLEAVQEEWNGTLRDIALRAVLGSVKIGDLQVTRTAIWVMVTYDIEESDPA